MRHSLGHIRQREHRPVDFAQLDALTADFQLIVAAAQIFHRAVVQPAGNVPGAVHSLAGGKRIGDKAAGGKVGASQIPLRQLNAGEIQIPRHAERHRAHHRVQNAQPRIPHREADRYAVAFHRRQLGAVRRIPADVHRCFGRAIEVVQRRMGELFPLATQRSRQRLAATEHLLQRPATVDVFRRQRGDERRQHRRHEVGGGYAIFCEEALHRQRIAVRVRLGHHQLRPGDKRPPELPHRHVKAARRFLRHHVMRRQWIMILHPLQAVNDGGMADHHPFWTSRRTGGKDDVRGLLRLRQSQRFSIGGR